MKALGIVFALVGFAVSVYVVLDRLAPESLAIIVGLACGAAALVPALAIALLAWRRSGTQPAPTTPPQQQQPTVIVVGGQALPQQTSPPQLPDYGGYEYAGHTYDRPIEPAREFRIIGGEDDDDEPLRPIRVAEPDFAEVHGEALRVDDAAFAPRDDEPDYDAIGYDLIEGMSIRQASLKHFGYEGGAAYRIVREIAADLDLI